MDDDTQALAGCSVGIIAVLISAFVFQYNVYTFTSKDVSLWLDLLAGILLLWPLVLVIYVFKCLMWVITRNDWWLE